MSGCRNSEKSRGCARPAASPGFTLLELLLAVSILTAVSLVTFLSFGAVITAWRRGLELSDDLHHGDYILEQLVMGLRSTYRPDAKEDGYFLLMGNPTGSVEERQALPKDVLVRLYRTNTERLLDGNAAVSTE